MDSKKEVTKEEIDKKVEELIGSLERFEGSQSDIVYQICCEIILWITEDHYTTLGITTAIMQNFVQHNITLFDDKKECSCKNE